MKNKAAQQMGSIKSKRKSQSSAANGHNQRTHLKKVEYFLRVHTNKLESNEWKKKFPTGKLTPTGKIGTYNPDFFCSKTKHFVEVVTSKPNISEQGWKWRAVIRNGVKLKIFWWEGEDITYKFIGKYSMV